MELFHIIEDGQAIMFSRGVYRQAKVFRRGTMVFAQHGGGFIRLMQGGATSVPTVAWKGVDALGVTADISGRAPVWGP